MKDELDALEDFIRGRSTCEDVEDIGILRT